MADQGFPTSKKLNNSKEFDAVFQSNLFRVSTAEILLLVRRNNVKHNRLGMVVAKRNTAKATSRNRLKRLIRETFRKVSPASLDIVVLTRSGINKKSNQVLNRKLLDAFASIVEKSDQQTVIET